jgi:hypothetical protein
MTKVTDDLEAVRQIAATLEEFDSAARERIIRWTREKLGMTAPPVVSLAGHATGSASASASLEVLRSPADIKSFIQAKNPRTDSQLAATVAYFHKFVAAESDRKDSIGTEELISACRLAERHRPTRPNQTLINAFSSGVLDKVSAGKYKLNSVGENLVAMVLSGDGSSSRRKAGATAKKKMKKKNG